ncbi:radical SAM protein [Paludibacter sp. 221]|uniref:radical SAM protein n=1 Tax=Paludibacter sp. 221 TaxID=2302939 RepID=UPI0013CFF45C|nr:radical SAM protein [Paludibacter sp. 221]NDV46113.1 radical SAM protein [Paludibacter sp. 221]
MRVGLIDVDGHNFPNLALMKISAYHKQKGDSVDWYSWLNGSYYYDIVYMSKVFTFTPDYEHPIASIHEIKGGTGYGRYESLPEYIENTQPDYSIYPISKWYDAKTAYGFLTRGCIRKCTWCIVPQKEGYIRTVSDIYRVANGFNKAILLDNNILASKDCIKHLNDIIESGCKVDFNQGLDSRLVTDEIAELLSRIKWIRYIRFAYDTEQQLLPLLSALHKLNKYGIDNSKVFVYCLLKSLNDSYERLNKAKELRVSPFAQPYRDFTNNQIIPQWQQDMARWCNHKATFKSVDFKDYQPRKGFYCREYF